MSQLSKYEMACLTAQVPCTDDPILNQIISASLRLRIATDMLNGMLSGDFVKQEKRAHFLAELALEQADALLKQFDGKKLDTERVETSATDA